MKARFLAIGFLFVSAPLFAQNVSITSFDRSSVATLSLLTVNGSGFNPSSGAISAVFSARDAITTTVPVAAATSSSVRVSVPALINSTNGNLFDTPIVAEVQLVQVTSTSVMTSNTLGGLTIAPTPQAEGPTGTFTKKLLQTVSDIQSDLRTARRSTAGFGDVMSASQAFSDGQRSLADAVDLIVRNADVTQNLQTTDNLPLLVSQKTVRAMDRVGSAFVQQSNNAFRTSSGGPVTTTACPCNPISDLDRSLCEFRQYTCNAYDPSRRVNSEGLTAAYGAQNAALASWASGGLSSASFVASETATGFEFMFSISLSYTTTVLAGTEPPGASTLMRDSGAQMLQDLADSGLGVASWLKSAADLQANAENAVQQSKGQLPTAPQGGILAPAPQPQSPPANTRPQNVYSGRQSHYWIATPINQGVTTLTAATQPAQRVSRFDGTYTGNASATCTVIIPGEAPVTAGGSAPGTATVSNGAVSGGGTVSNNGRFTAPVQGAGGVTCTGGGVFFVDGAGGAGASGYITCGGAGVSCAGTWTLRRQ